MISVSIIGPGRVGGALALSLPSNKYRIDALIGRRPLEGEASKLFGRDLIVGLADVESIDSDIVFIATGDAQIKDVSRELAEKLKPGGSVFHTSGALTSDLLEGLSTIGREIGSIHPLVSISTSELGPERFAGAYFCIEGTPEAIDTAQEIVSDLQGLSFTISTKYKALYHAAAVMACGHLVALFDSAVEVLSSCGLSGAESKKILLPLVKSTVDNLATQSTSSALTGTFGRADTEVFTRHLTTLNENVSDDLLEIYLLLGERSLQLAAKEGVNAERIETMLTKMSVAKSRLKW